MLDAVITKTIFLGGQVLDDTFVPEVAGTILIAIQIRLDGDADDGKFWDDDDDTWQASPIAYPACTHRGGGFWDFELPVAALTGKLHGFLKVTAMGDAIPATDKIGGMYDTAYITNNYRANETLDALLANHIVASSFGELFQQGTVITGAAVNTSAESYVLTTGTESANGVADTEALDGTEHQHTDDGGVMDLYYQFDIGGDGLPTGVSITGRMTGANDDLDGVYAYDWAGVGWTRIGDFDGQNGPANVTRTYQLLVKHVGTGANLGKVRIRFWAAAGLTTSTLYVNQIITSYAVTSRTVGYADGSIWVDTGASNTNTEVFVDGVADNPVSTWAAALTLSTALGIQRFHILNGSAITLSADTTNFSLMGEAWDLDLNGQTITQAHFTGCHEVIGIGVGSDYDFIDCDMGVCALAAGHLKVCGLSGPITLTEAGAYFWDRCYSEIAGTSTPCVDFGAAVGNTQLNIRHYSGGIEIENMGGAGTDNMSLEGEGQLVVNADCSGGTVAVRGHFNLTDNAAGAVTFSDDARFTQSEVVDGVWDEDIVAAHGTADTGGLLLRALAALISQRSNSATLHALLGVADSAGVDLPEQIDTELTATHGAGAWTASASAGARAITVSITDLTPDPVLGVRVDVYDASNTTLITSVLDSDLDGDVVINLDDGTYSVRLYKPGFAPTNVVETLVVTADASETYTGTVVTGSAPADPTLCGVFGTLRDASGIVHAGVTVNVYSLTPQIVDSVQRSNRIATTTTDVNGFFQVNLERNGRVFFEIEDAHIENALKDVPDAATQDLATWADVVL